MNWTKRTSNIRVRLWRKNNFCTFCVFFFHQKQVTWQLSTLSFNSFSPSFDFSIRSYIFFVSSWLFWRTIEKFIYFIIRESTIRQSKDCRPHRIFWLFKSHFAIDTIHLMMMMCTKNKFNIRHHLKLPIQCVSAICFKKISICSVVWCVSVCVIVWV